MEHQLHYISGLRIIKLCIPLGKVKQYYDKKEIKCNKIIASVPKVKGQTWPSSLCSLPRGCTAAGGTEGCREENRCPVLQPGHQREAVRRVTEEKGTPGLPQEHRV